MFLATTALDEFWDKNQDILFAGEWCKLYDEKKKYAEINAVCFPYQWGNISNLDLAINEIDKAYKNILPVLLSVLNNYLDINKDDKYYSIILGHWLIRFIHSSYDKFNLLENIIKEYDANLNTTILSRNDFVIPVDEKEYGIMVGGDYYNLQEYSRIIEFMNITSSYARADKKPKQTTQYRNTTNIKKKLLFFLLNLFKKNDITISHPYFSDIRTYFNISTKSNNIVFNNFDYKFKINMQVDSEFRKTKIYSKSKSRFERYLFENILLFMPLVFIEGHRQIVNELSKCNIKKSKIYYNAVGIQSTTIYKFFIAGIHKKIKLATHQHGAGYGVDFECCDEKYERCISDKYFTFGWGEDLKTSYLPTEKLHIKPHDKKAKNVLMVLTNSPRYVRRLLYLQKSSEIIDATVNPVVKFLNTVKDNNIKIRFYPVDYGWSVERRVFDNTNYFTKSNEKFSREFKKSKLIILEHLGTTFYESLASNKPTIAFIDKNIYKFRKEAEFYFDKLHDVGILHYSAESAAKHYLFVIYDIYRWWESNEVQCARGGVVNKYARTVDNWTRKFVYELNNYQEFYE